MFDVFFTKLLFKEYLESVFGTVHVYYVIFPEGRYCYSCILKINPERLNTLPKVIHVVSGNPRIGI